MYAQPPQHTTTTSKRAQLHNTKAIDIHNSQTTKMEPQSDKPVFFFDIDNCVGVRLPMYESKTANYIVALSKEFETLYIIT